MIFLSAPEIGLREYELVEQALASNFIAPAGPMLERFEIALANYTGFERAVAVSSGTAAIHLALRVLGIEAGDVVVVPSFTFIGSVGPVVQLGAKPVFLDCDARTWLLEPQLLDDALTTLNAGGTPARAVIGVDLYGQPTDVVGLRLVCERHGADFLVDAAESLGSFRGGKHAGKGAKLAALSFNGNKIITTSGGGALITEDAEIAERVRYLSQQARQPVPHYEHIEVGYNFRMSNICAAIGLAQMESLEAKVAHRRRVHAGYGERLAAVEGVRLEPVSASDSRENRWLTTVLLDRQRLTPEAFCAALLEQGIEARRLWKPMHLQPVFAGSKVFGGEVCAGLFDQGLCLPSGPQVTPDIQDRVCKALNDMLERRLG